VGPQTVLKRRRSQKTPDHSTQPLIEGPFWGDPLDFFQERGLSGGKKTLMGIGLNSNPREAPIANQSLLFLKVLDKILKMLKNRMKPVKKKAGE